MRKRIWQTAFIALIIGLTSASSNAQQGDSQAIAAAQSLVDEAGELMDAKKFAEACPKLEQATKLVPKGIGSRLALAECYVGLGRLASAQGQYLQAEALARAAKDSRAREAASEAAKLKPKLATITLTVADELRSIDGLVLTWDGVVWESAIWGTPIPVDVGKHVLEMHAPKWKPWTTEVNIEANGRASKQDVPMLERAPAETPTRPAVPPMEPLAQKSSWMQPVGITASALGAAGLIAGGVFGTLAITKLKASNTDGHCDAKNLCNAAGVSLRQESLGFARASSVLIPVGLVLGGGGIALLIASAPGKKKSDSAMTNQIQWHIDAGPAWIGLRGFW